VPDEQGQGGARAQLAVILHRMLMNGTPFNAHCCGSLTTEHKFPVTKGFFERSPVARRMAQVRLPQQWR